MQKVVSTLYQCVGGSLIYFNNSLSHVFEKNSKSKIHWISQGTDGFYQFCVCTNKSIYIILHGLIKQCVCVCVILHGHVKNVILT